MNIEESKFVIELTDNRSNSEGTTSQPALSL